MIARSGLVAYGKFFGKKAGFISKARFPDFDNWRRDSYDFDSRWDDVFAIAHQKKIMDQFTEAEALLSYELKERAGFGKRGEKNFEGTVTDLQMSSYLVIRDFRQKLNKKSSLTAGHRQSIRRRKRSGERSVSPRCMPPIRPNPGRKRSTRFRPIFPPPPKRDCWQCWADAEERSTLMKWAFEIAGLDGDCRLFGVNIFKAPGGTAGKPLL